jgi:hypothetical protein
MKIRTSFVSNSSSSSFIIAIRGENNKILKEFFEKDDGWIKDLEDENDAFSENVKKFKKDGFKLFVARTDFDERSSTMTKFIEKVTTNKFKDIKLVHVSLS